MCQGKVEHTGARDYLYRGLHVTLTNITIQTTTHTQVIFIRVVYLEALSTILSAKPWLWSCITIIWITDAICLHGHLYWVQSQQD